MTYVPMYRTLEHQLHLPWGTLLVLQIGESIVGLMEQAWNLVHCPQVDHASVVDIGPSQIQLVIEMVAIFKMAAIAYLKFFYTINKNQF